jgi:hypothetical protein
MQCCLCEHYAKAIPCHIRCHILLTIGLCGTTNAIKYKRFNAQRNNNSEHSGLASVHDFPFDHKLAN